MLNERLSHYTILERIGAGGMGVVYRARDERLERDVALKVLPPDLVADEEARRRLGREARALSRLNHPNIATVFDFDSDGSTSFIAMEWVPGQTLDERVAQGDRLTDEELAAIATQAADALLAAHEAGVIHRDLKPANLRLTPEGRLKVLDFGLALRTQSGDSATTAAVTESREVAGTLAFMPPESFTGRAPDAQGDLYSLGVVLYEMATGRRPFTGDTPAQLIYAILHHAPVAPRVLNPAISQAMQTVILRLLEREPGRRYSSARALREDLGNPSGAGRSAPAQDAKRTIAVLPLENLSGDSTQEYFADGMTEALIGDLARMRELRVISRTSAMRYKGVRRAIPEIAAELNVETILEGSVLKSGDRLRVSVQLIDARSDTHLWTERYDRPMQDVLTLQSDLAHAVAAEIRAALVNDPAERDENSTHRNRSGRTQPAATRVMDPEVYDLFLRGRHQLNRRSDESLHRAAEFFDQAIARDPTYALAHLGAAEAHGLMAFHEFEPPSEAFPRARAAAECALAIAPDLGEAHAALAYVELHHDRNWAGAERTFQRAIELNPNHAVTRLWYVNLLAVSARFEEALEQCQRAIELDPLSIVHNLVTGWVLFFQRRYDVAYQRMERALELEPGFFQAYYWRGWALWKMGRAEEAAAHLEISSRLAQHAPTVLHLRALNAAFAGRLDDARAILSQMETMRSERYVSAFSIGLGHAVVGDLDAAEPWIERAAEERSPWIGFMRVDSRTEALRGRPRMDAIRDRLGEGV